MNRKGNRKWPSPAKKGFQRKQAVRPNPLHFKGVALKTGPKHHRHQDRNKKKEGDGQLPRQGSKRGRQACRRQGVQTGSPRTRGREGRRGRTTQQEEGGRTTKQEEWRTGDQTGRGGLGPNLLGGAWEGVGSLSSFGCRMQIWQFTPYGFVGRGSSVGLVV